MHSSERVQGGGGRVVTDTDALIQGYSNYLSALKKSPRTVEEYTKDVQRWSVWWKRPVEFFKQDEWDDWVFHLTEDGVSGRSINRYRCSLKRFYRYLRRKKIVEHDPSYDSEAAGTEKKLPVVLTRDETEQIRRRLKAHRTRALFALLYDCGLRSQEARELTVDRISADSVHVTGKGAKDRIVPFPPSVYETLKAWLEVRPKGTTWVFPTAGGSVVSEPTVYRLVKRIAAPLLKKVTPHTLRHGIATHLIANGMPIERLQAWLGHESIETTRIYVKLAQQQVKEAILAAHPSARNGEAPGQPPGASLGRT